MRTCMLVLCALLLSTGTASAERHSLIVLSQGNDTVYDLNPATGQVLKQCQLAGAPREAIFSWDERTLFVSVPDAGHVAIVDVATFIETGRIEAAAPMGLATTHDGKLYVGADGGLLIYDSRLLVYNPEVKQAGKRIAVQPKDRQYFKLQGTTDKIYYPHRRDNQVIVIDTRTDSVVKTVPVPGGPMDVAFVPGGEVWVQTESGSIAVIDSSKDEVKQVITTSGKGAGRIALAPDIRYVATTHADTGDTTIVHPLKKEVLGTVKTGRGAAGAAFVPAAKSVQRFLPQDPTDQLYVAHAGDADVAIIDLNKMAVASRHKVGESLGGALIHYSFHQGWIAPRATTRRVLETDLFTLYANAMFLYDVSPIHEHRTDMAGVFTGTGVAKIGCWDPACPPEVVPKGAGGLPYNNTEGRAGTFTNISRGTLHQEEGGSPSPRRMMTFDLKNNYYRQTQPKASVLEKAGLRKIGENPRVIAWDVTLKPGDKPIVFPEGGEYAVVYIGGGLLRIVRDGHTEIVDRYFNEWDWKPYAHTVESLTHPVMMVILEFK